MGIGRNIDHERLDDLRRGRGPVQEHVIDEFVGGRLSRRDFIRKGSAMGLSMGLIGGILAACGSSGTSTSSSSSAPAGKAGATIKAGFLTPVGAINPITINDQGGLELLGNIGEFLVFTDHSGIYHPWLATSWSANPDAGRGRVHGILPAARRHHALVVHHLVIGAAQRVRWRRPAALLQLQRLGAIHRRSRWAAALRFVR